MSRPLRLPVAGGGLVEHTPSPARDWTRPRAPLRSRLAYAAAHVVADPWGENVPGAPAVVDWESTLAVRRQLWSWGLGVADAMDTAQRGMGLDPATVEELVRRSAAEAAALGGAIVCGAGTDVAPADLGSLDEVVSAYERQVELVETAGAGVVLMASRQLARLARGPEDFALVYDKVLGQVARPVVLHWLGEVFDPSLAGYWGARDPWRALDTVVTIVTEHVAAVDGIKVSVLNEELERELRRRLPEGVRVYTGDDYHYADLILGRDGERGSDALLGAFAAVAPAASAALQALDAGDVPAYEDALRPTVPLSRHLFAAPTPSYKVGIAFLAWLRGEQPGFTMVAGLQSARSAVHLAETYRLADAAGVLPDPDLAAARMRGFLEVAGVGR